MAAATAASTVIPKAMAPTVRGMLAEPGGATVDREGIASAVDPTALRFTLTPEEGVAIVVSWSDATYFGGVSPATLSGKKVHAEGSIVNGILVATQVKLED